MRVEVELLTYQAVSMAPGQQLHLGVICEKIR
jgi:hypothetical protein